MRKTIIYFGNEVKVECDEKCHKAWGMNNRPTVQLSADIDDFAYLSDDELGIAPIDPQTYEGGQAKPTSKQEMLNKWCVRECERCVMSDIYENKELPDFSKRV